MPSKNPKNRTNRDVQAARAAELRAEGATLKQIADELDTSVATAGRWVTEGRERANDREADAMGRWRDAQVAEMEKVQAAGWAIYERMQVEDQQGVPVDYKAAAALGQVVNAGSRIAKLWGLDAPVKVQGTFEVEMDEETARQIWEEEHGDA